jgi:hypothetical protein
MKDYIMCIQVPLGRNPRVRCPHHITSDTEQMKHMTVLHCMINNVSHVYVTNDLLQRNYVIIISIIE